MKKAVALQKRAISIMIKSKLNFHIYINLRFNESDFPVILVGK